MMKKQEMRDVTRSMSKLALLAVCALAQGAVAQEPPGGRRIGAPALGARRSPPGSGATAAGAPVPAASPSPSPSASPSPSPSPSVKPATKATPKPAAATPAGTAAAAAAADIPMLPGEKEAIQECRRYPSNKKFEWSLKGEVDLMTLLHWAEPVFCRPFIIPGNVRQSKVTVLAPNTVTAPEAYRIFLSALESMGLTVQPQGKVLKIIESSRAKETAIPLYTEGEDAPSQETYVTRLMRLENVDTAEIAKVLAKLKGKDGDITEYAPTNTLIITDVASNIRRMEEVVKQLDIAMGGERIWTIKLRAVSAGETATLLQNIFGVGKPGQAAPPGAKRAINIGGKPGTPPAPTATGKEGRGAAMSISQIIPEERSNLLIIVATEQAYQKVLALVRRLDQITSGGDVATDRVHVIPLENANADDVAGTLGGLGAGVSRSGSSAGGKPGSASPASSPGGAAGAHALFESDVRIASDKPTNSLVVVASGRDFQTVRDLIKKLDIPRRQVFVEATILEVSIDKSRKLGVSWHAGSTVDTGTAGGNSLLFGGSIPNSSTSSLVFSPAALSGLAAGLRGPPIPGADTILGLPAGTSIPSFGAFIQALQNNGDVNVVSMPHILTTDNEKATIKVGQNLPFPGSLGAGLGALGSAAGAAGALGGLGLGTSVQRQDVALTMDITPHVNDSDFVRLEIDNELSDVANPNFNGLGPSTSKRTIKSVVTVRDQQTIVLGGLIKDRVSEQVDKIPLLGDIPILGYLFKTVSKTVLKQNLLIVITPYVIKDPNDLRRIFERKIRERREFLEQYSAFRDEKDYEAQVDYRRKRGLLEEINRVAAEAELDAEDLRKAEAAMRARDIEGPVEIAPVAAPTEGDK